jgi:formylglycine-generating enzyme required for sulfatase activity
MVSKASQSGSISWFKGVNCTGWRVSIEAEWEFAARGGKSHKYAGSNNLDEVAWYSFNRSSKTHSVCGKDVNPSTSSNPAQLVNIQQLGIPLFSGGVMSFCDIQ